MTELGGWPSQGLEPHQLTALLRTLPECRLSGPELSKRVADALSVYWVATHVQKHARRRPGAAGKHRDAIEAAARKLASLLGDPGTHEALVDVELADPVQFLDGRLTTVRLLDEDLAAELGGPLQEHAVVSASPLIDELAERLDALVAVTRAARKSAPQAKRGSDPDPALDDLICSLASVYRDATGRAPTASRDVHSVLSGPWFDFWTQATAFNPCGRNGQGVFGKIPPTLDAVYSRARRLGLLDRKSAKQPIDGNRRNATKPAIVMASGNGGADAKNNRRARRRDRSGGRARP